MKNVKSIFAVAALFGFIALAVFGALPMHGNMGHAVCASAYSNAADCPLKQNPIDFANFHLNALRSFSTAVFSSQAFLMSFLFALLLLLVASSLFAKMRLQSAQVSTVSRVRLNPLTLQNDIRSWLAIFEKRDPAGH